ncbi:MAG: transposase [Bacteroidetes bacterium]|nr:transposase [Bacteroidota bacterium]
METVRGLFVKGTPILRHLAQNERISVKKQGDKYSYHLGNIELKQKVEKSALNKVRNHMRKNTVIAYDLTDISKESARKMEKISRVFDGSKRKTTNGYTLHGLGVNGILLKLEVHEGAEYTQNQIRKKIVKEYSQKFEQKGIWVFDRGNDDKAFFKYLRHKRNAQFVARLRSNRGVVVKKTGAIMKVENLPVGNYQVYLMNKQNTDVDLRAEFTLVISSHLDEDKQPIRLLASLKHTYSSEEIVNIYLQRWGIENIFKRAKQKFNLEKIRVLNYRKFVNLIALIQFAINVSTITFIKIQKSTYSLISGVLIYYKKFLKLKALTFNLDSFISFIKFALKPLIPRCQKDGSVD